MFWSRDYSEPGASYHKIDWWSWVKWKLWVVKAWLFYGSPRCLKETPDGPTGFCKRRKHITPIHATGNSPRKVWLT